MRCLLNSDFDQMMILKASSFFDEHLMDTYLTFMITLNYPHPFGFYFILLYLFS
jgi:hypothetical protein